MAKKSSNTLKQRDKKMKYAIITAAVVAISATSMEAKADCGKVFSTLNEICKDKSMWSTEYWTCKTGASVAFGICKVMQQQVSSAVGAELNKKCKVPHSKGCEELLDKVVANAAKKFAKEPDFNKQQLLDEIKKDTSKKK